MDIMLQHFDGFFGQLEDELENLGDADHWSVLSKVSPDLFGLMLWRKSALYKYPLLSSNLLDLPSEDIQARFAGGRGEALLPRACSFVNYLQAALHKFGVDRSPKILDYGCGWGRLTRFLPALTASPNIFAVDPNSDVLTHLAGAKFRANVKHVDQVPDALPFREHFDLCFLFSIFTHLPPLVIGSIVSVLREYMNPGSLVVCTIRPKAFWPYYLGDSKTTVEELTSAHDDNGFAFLPQGDNQLYGDVSYSDEFIQELLNGFTLRDRAYSALDPYQLALTFQRDQ